MVPQSSCDIALLQRRQGTLTELLRTPLLGSRIGTRFVCLPVLCWPPRMALIRAGGEEGHPPPGLSSPRQTGHPVHHQAPPLDLSRGRYGSGLPEVFSLPPVTETYSLSFLKKCSGLGEGYVCVRESARVLILCFLKALKFEWVWQAVHELGTCLASPSLETGLATESPPTPNMWWRTGSRPSQPCSHLF